MRLIYTRQLADLAHTLRQMAGLAGTAMQLGTRALLDADLAAAESVTAGCDTITELSQYAQEQTFAVLALQSPVARDLRQVVSGIHIVAEVERMGALALHVAKIARRRHPLHVLPVEVSGHFAEMGHIAVALAGSVAEILETRDPQRATQLAEEDEAMDELHRQLFTVVMDPHWTYGVQAAVDVTLLGRFYERFADHAVAVGHRVAFLATGAMPATLHRRECPARSVSDDGGEAFGFEIGPTASLAAGTV